MLALDVEQGREAARANVRLGQPPANQRDAETGDSCVEQEDGIVEDEPALWLGPVYTCSPEPRSPGKFDVPEQIFRG